MSSNHIQLGKAGEQRAQKFLRKKGLRIISTNFRTRSGEIDIICEENKTIVFVEVKTRKSQFLDSPFEAVTPRKQQQISKVALEYLHHEKRGETNVRFDVISITEDKKKITIEHLENAFELSYGR